MRTASMSRSWARPSALRAVAALVVIAFIASGFTSPASAARPRAKVAVASSSSIKVGQSAKISVKVAPRSRTVVTLQAWSAARRAWVYQARTRLNAASKATFTRKRTAAGTVSYRVKVSATTKRRAVTSRTVKTKVVKPAAKPSTQKPAVTTPAPAPSAPAPTPSAPAPTQSTPPVQSEPESCGTRTVRKDDGSAWECTYHDEFDGTTLDRSFWVPQVTRGSGFISGTTDLYACYEDDDRVISVADGSLNLSVQRLDEARDCGKSKSSNYLAGSVMHYGTFSQTYGKYEVRAKLPDVRSKGSQTTFWLWPVDLFKYGTSHPESGEIDFAEFYSSYPDLVVPMMHYLPGTVDLATHRNLFTAYNCPIAYGEYNTYGLEWTPGKLKIFVNGKLCVENNYDATNAPLSNPYAPFDQPFFLALTQAMGTTGNEYDPATAPTRMTTSIDYVRIWK